MNQLEKLILLYDLKKYNLVIKAVSESASLMNDAEALLLLAKSNRAIDQFVDAKQILETILVMDPEHIWAKFELAKILIRQNSEKAERLIQDCLEMDPNESAFWGMLGNIQMRKKQWKVALTSLTKSLALDPQQTLALVNTGICYSELKDFEKAIATFENAIEQDPGHYNSYTNLAVVYNRTGKLDLAYSYYLQALQINPNLANAVYGLACVHALKSEKNEALHFLERSFQLDSRLRRLAHHDADFEKIKDDPDFLNLLN